MHLRSQSFSVFLLVFIASVTAQESERVETPEISNTTQTTQVVERTIALSDGRLKLTAPASWVKKKPRTNIVEFEFSIPAVEGDSADGRLTVMGAGGGVQANVTRWISQFQSADGGSVKNSANPDQNEIDGEVVHWVDLAGTYADKPRGPFGPTTERQGYRMLAAIIATKKHGQYFVKCYGPAKTIAESEKSFHEFVQSLKVNREDH